MKKLQINRVDLQNQRRKKKRIESPLNERLTAATLAPLESLSRSSPLQKKTKRFSESNTRQIYQTREERVCVCVNEHWTLYTLGKWQIVAFT